ncbi:MAG: regulatory protein RecX [Gammaproteobacteria bacterium]
MRPSKLDPGAADDAACKRAAVELLARREHSRLELERKLARRGFPKDVIAPALDALEHSGVLVATRFTESFIRSRIAKGQGPTRIRAELAERGVAGEQTVQLLRGGDVDWLATARAVRRKRFGDEPPRDFRERAKQARFLQYRGFTSDQVRAALELDGDSE